MAALLRLCFQAAARLLDELCQLTAQSLSAMNTSEHFQVLKLLGEGSYGKVMLAVHRTRGAGTLARRSGQPRGFNATLCPPRHSHGAEVLPSGVHLALLLPEGVQLLSVLLHTPVSDQRAGNRLLHAFTLHFRPAGRPVRRPLHPHPARGTVPACRLWASSGASSQDESPFIRPLRPPQVGLEEDCCQRVVSQLCGALSHLHSLGFVHRDLKPENVFVCDAACRWVKLGDYGMVSVDQGQTTADGTPV